MTMGGAEAGSSTSHKTTDFHLISRSDAGEFLGSHKIYKRKSEGLSKVTYCGRGYWVSAKTVAWTQVEVENSREVRVEYNNGKGWRAICEKPEREVTLADLGIDIDAQTVASGNDTALKWIHRFNAVKVSFRDKAFKRK